MSQLELKARVVVVKKVGGVIDAEKLNEADAPAALVVPQANALDVVGVEYLRVRGDACEAVENVVLGRVAGQTLDDDGGRWAAKGLSAGGARAGAAVAIIRRFVVVGEGDIVLGPRGVAVVVLKGGRQAAGVVVFFCLCQEAQLAKRERLQGTAALQTRLKCLQAMRLYPSASDSIHDRPLLGHGGLGRPTLAIESRDGSCGIDRGRGRGTETCTGNAVGLRRTWQLLQEEGGGRNRMVSNERLKKRLLPAVREH